MTNCDWWNIKCNTKSSVKDGILKSKLQNLNNVDATYFSYTKAMHSLNSSLNSTSLEKSFLRKLTKKKLIDTLPVQTLATSKEPAQQKQDFPWHPCHSSKIYLLIKSIADLEMTPVTAQSKDPCPALGIDSYNLCSLEWSIIVCKSFCFKSLHQLLLGTKNSKLVYAHIL